MGWNTIMPLLSTLAALVIIVHSFEEMDDYEHRISPRLLEVGSSEYDQRWRTIDVEPMMQESAPETWHEIAPQESPKRRRPGRKRKRRPQQEDEPIREVHEFEDAQPYQKSESQVVYETTELPRRRRKRPEMRNNPWNEETQETNRPTRRRGQRRRRPQNRENEEDDAVIGLEEQRPQNDEQRSEEDRWKSHDEERFNFRLEPKSEDQRPAKRNKRPVDDKYVVDKSLSGSEEVQSRGMLDISATSTSTTEAAIPENGVTMDALSLKELLKRSDGASLSEILQRRNLSLADLLNGKENALSVLQTDYPTEDKDTNSKQNVNDERNIQDIINKEHMTLSEESTTPSMINENTLASVSELTDNSEPEQKLIIKTAEPANIDKAEENRPKISTRRRFPQGIRRRQRIKSPLNDTSTLNVGFMPQNPRRTVKKMLTNPSKRENVFDIESSVNINNENHDNVITTSPSTTISDISENSDVTSTSLSPATITTSTTTESFEEAVQNVTYSAKATTKSATITSSRDYPNTEPPLEDLLTDKSESPVTNNRSKILIPTSDVRRQVLTNRLKKKRMKPIISEIDSPDETVKDIFGMANLVSASEFIAKIQSPDATLATTDLDDIEPFISTLQDVTMPDEITTNKARTKPKLNPTHSFGSTTNMYTPVTEETAKVEIDEILNDSHSGARLSKILLERNMTINELVEHRERGSSQVHLADIFHNTSIEPNPPEPFLSKSLIEPISKETYPLRALLEANHHDPSVRLQTKDLNSLQFVNIPIAMDFGNNVNENGENLGIVSLFNKFNNTIEIDARKIKTDSQGTPYFTSVSTVNTNDTVREGRGLQDDELIALKEIFTNVKMPQTNEKVPNYETTEKALQSTTSLLQQEDSNDDELNVLDDLQNDIDSSIATMSNEKLEASDEEETSDSGLLENIPSNAKSVTVATAAIAGLTMLLFLITYFGCKWKNQRNVMRKRETLSEERIQTPVFESRKLSKINSSNRSISPMLSNSNIYTMSTLDSRNGKDSPDYMWDSLRKPFQ